MTSDSKDCLECRLTSGFGLIGISAYVYYQTKHRKKWETYTMRIASICTFMLGGARLLNISYLKSAKD